MGTSKKRNLYAVFDFYGKKISASMYYKKALEAKKKVQSASRAGALQATVATPPFKVRKV